MTSKIILPLAAIILLSSCAGKLGLQKRRYNKGYYFSVSKHTAAPKKEAERTVAITHHESVKTVQVAQAIQNQVANTNPEVLPVVKHEAPITAALPTAAPVAKQHPVLTADAKKQLISEIKTFKNVAAVVKHQQKKGGSSDGNLVLLVILSLFPILALIAIYIHDGHKITTNFWIDLILHLTIIGYIIYALLVVLDVVDLS